MLGEQIDILVFTGEQTYKRYPKIRVIDLEIIE